VTARISIPRSVSDDGPWHRGARSAERSTSVHIVTFPQRQTPTQLRHQIVDLERQAWPPAGSADDCSWEHDPALAPLSVVLLVDDRLVSSLSILSKQLDHAGQTFHAAGLSTVVTESALHGRGYGRALVTAAKRIMAERGVDVALFTCDRPLQRFYERAGWHVLPGTVLVGGTRDEPLASDEPGFDKVTMGDFLSAHGRDHAAHFENARIELYPGAIDRLW
jgi:aminoglycoside 2'-N-acetyltransferase I